jgi:hypothetical protein
VSIYGPKDLSKYLYFNAHQGLIHAPKDENYTLCGMMIKGNPLMEKTDKDTTRDNMCTNCYLEMIGNMFKKS